MALITIPYAPRDWQLNEHMSIARFTVLVVHRRAGKTFFAVNELIKRVLDPMKNRPQVAYIAPTYRQAKAVSWEIFKQMVAPIPGVKINESELRIDFPNGGRILVLGAENPDSLRGLYLDYVVLDEVADMPAHMWGTIIRPALADRQGGALFIGTPKGKNFFHELYVRGKTMEGWKSTLLTWRETKALNAEEIEALRKELSEEEFEQELECSFTAAIRGAYFGKNMARAEHEGRITRVRYNPDFTVYASWDIGFDGTSIWYQQFIEGQPRFIDFDHFEDKDVPYCANVVKNKNYTYEGQLIPHDGVKRQPLDKKKTVKGYLEGIGLKCILVPRQPVEVSIQAGRRLLDRALFDIDKCSKAVKTGAGETAVGIESLRQFRAKYDDNKGIQSDDYVHDRHSHPAFSFCTMAIGMKANPVSTQRRPGIIGQYDPFRVNHNTVQDQWDVYNSGAQ